MFELPALVVATCYVALVTATIVIFVLLHLHMRNYRKPFQQRLMLRINLIVPLFAWLCYRMLLNQNLVFTKYFVEPLREVYEAFVIYTFYSLLTVMLGGERQIIVMTLGRPPVHHPVFPLSRILPPVDISDPQTFLYIKRGILQYVWLKPFLCFTILIGEVVGFYNVNDMLYKLVYLWLTVVYNITVSLSLYCLALFWKILWTDLKPFNPIGKFLCVKLIIFALYWQGVILAILNATGQLPEMGHHQSTAVAIQNALLCVELIPFAVGHWISFNWRDFSLAKLPLARVKWYYAMRDWLGIKDLIWDFKLTYHGDYYDYRQFDSVDALIAHPNLRGRTKKIQEGFRYHPDGQQKHWVDNNSVNEDPTRPILSTQERRAVGGYAALINSLLKAMYEVTPDDTPSGSTNNNTNNGSGDAFESEEPSLRGEGLDIDEVLYQEAIATINNYNLDKPQVRRLLKYPVVDEMVLAHQYGYRVNQLRQQQQRGYGAV